EGRTVASEPIIDHGAMRGEEAFAMVARGGENGRRGFCLGCSALWLRRQPPKEIVGYPPESRVAGLIVFKIGGPLLPGAKPGGDHGTAEPCRPKTVRGRAGRTVHEVLPRLLCLRPPVDDPLGLAL